MKKCVIPTAEVLSRMVRSRAAEIASKRLVISEVLSFGEATLDGNKAAVDGRAGQKLGYFSIWSNGSIQAVVVIEETMQEVHSADYCGNGEDDVELEFDKWIAAFQ